MSFSPQFGLKDIEFSDVESTYPHRGQSSSSRSPRIDSHFIDPIAHSPFHAHPHPTLHHRNSGRPGSTSKSFDEDCHHSDTNTLCTTSDSSDDASNNPHSFHPGVNHDHNDIILTAHDILSPTISLSCPHSGLEDQSDLEMTSLLPHNNHLAPSSPQRLENFLTHLNDKKYRTQIDVIHCSSEASIFTPIQNLIGKYFFPETLSSPALHPPTQGQEVIHDKISRQLRTRAQRVEAKSVNLTVLKYVCCFITVGVIVVTIIAYTDYRTSIPP